MYLNSSPGPGLCCYKNNAVPSLQLNLCPYPDFLHD